MTKKYLSKIQKDGQVLYIKDVEARDSKQDKIDDLATIRSGAALGATAIQTETDPTVPSWAKLSSKPSYNANEVGALPSSTKYGATIDLSLNTTDYKLTISLKDQDGTQLNSKTVDFPIESVVVNGSYNNQTKKIILTLQNGNTTDVPVGDLVAGLQTEITSVSMLDADLVDDINSTHKFVTAQEKTTWNGKQDALTFNTTPSSSNKVATMSDVKTDIDERLLLGDTMGHTYVDLGLPSGTLWATMNVGANSETGYGNYYMYGKGATQYNSSDTSYTGTEDPLDLSVDTARQVWGGSWHMPTRTQIQELMANTTYQWVTNYKGSGINGGTFTATNGTVLFIPAAGFWRDGSQYFVGDGGFCWGSSPDGSSSAFDLYFDSSGYKDVGSSVREVCFSVRPVLNKTEKYATKTELATKQDVIDSSHKLSADLVDDTNSTHKFVTTQEKTTWNNKSDFSGSYNDLTDKPTIPAAQVQSDWNATSGMGVILNKPTIPTVPTNVSAFTNDAGYLTSHQDISGKEDKITIDSTTKLSSFTAYVGNYYKVNFPANGSITITLATTTSTYVGSCIFRIVTDINPSLTINYESGNALYYAENYEIKSSSIYEINALWNGNYWSIASVKFNNTPVVVSTSGGSND